MKHEVEDEIKTANMKHEVEDEIKKTEGLLASALALCIGINQLSDEENEHLLSYASEGVSNSRGYLETYLQRQKDRLEKCP